MIINEKIKSSLEKLFISLPYFILAVIVGTILIYIYKNIHDYEKMINILQIFIWPAIVIMALLFFRKVFTYLFLSMEEFNFFGTKGRLRDIKEVIEERVQNRVQEIQNENKRSQELKKIVDDFENTKQSKDSADQKAVEWENIAKDIFSKYKDLSESSIKITKELNDLRQIQSDRDARIAAMRDRIKRSKIRKSEECENSSEVPKADKSQSDDENMDE